MFVISDTPRLELRDLRGDDAVILASLLNNERISSNLARVKHPYTLDDAHNWIASLRDGGDSVRALAISLSGQPVGVVGIEKERSGDAGDLGYWLAEPWWGKGYVGRAARAVVGHAFTDLGYELITSGYRHGNEASRRILDRLGFRHTGHQWMFSAGRKAMMRVASVEITRREWLRRMRSERGDARR